MVCSGAISRIGYSKTLTSKSDFGLRFSTTQQSGARSIRHRRVTCVAASADVSLSFKISSL